MNRSFGIYNIFSRSDSSEYEASEESDEEIILEENARFLDIYRTYVDTNELRLENVKDAVLVYYFIDKFKKPDITNYLADYLRKNLCVENVLQVFEHANELKQYELVKICWEYILNNTSEILKHDSFITAKYNTVMDIISSDTLAVHSELEVYNAAVRYGKETFMEKNPRILREKIFPLLKEVRFISMTYSEFSGSPCTDGLLTKEEQLEIFRIKSNYIVKRDEMSLMQDNWINVRWFEFLSSCYRSSECKNCLNRERSQKYFPNIEQQFLSRVRDLKVYGVTIQVNVKLRNNNNIRLNANVAFNLRIYNLVTDEEQFKYLKIFLPENKNFSDTEKIRILLQKPVVIRKREIFKIDLRSLLINEDIAEFKYCTNDYVTYDELERVDYNGDDIHHDNDDKPHIASIIATY